MAVFHHAEVLWYPNVKYDVTPVTPQSADRAVDTGTNLQEGSACIQHTAAVYNDHLIFNRSEMEWYSHEKNSCNHRQYL